MNRNITRNMVLLALALFATLTVRHFVTGGLRTIKLQAAPPLAYAVSQSLVLSGLDKDLPRANVDYQVQDVQYFYNNQWAVAKVYPLQSKGDVVFVVLKKVNGYYQAVIPPSNELSNSYVYTLPNDVAGYLDQAGVLHG